jgi:hypothetical protein
MPMLLEYGLGQNVVITDELLLALTISSPTDLLIPRLRSIVLVSLLRFSNSVFAEFAASRQLIDRPDPGPFALVLGCIEGYERGLSVKCTEELVNLVHDGVLRFSVRIYPYE